MDAKQFDTLARSPTDPRSRREAMAAVVGGALGVAGLAETEAKKKKRPCPPCKKRKQGTCKTNLPNGKACAGGTCQDGRCVLNPTCTDGSKNGNETGVDCGGPDCPRCANGQGCLTRNDCASAFCEGGICQPCATELCAKEAGGGGCGCRAPEQVAESTNVCFSLRRVPSGDTPCTCPTDSVCMMTANVETPVACFKLCDAF